MTLLVASLYLLITAFLFGSAIYILSRDPFARINQAYSLLALVQLGWVGTLFVFNATPVGPDLIWIGRANFAAAALVVPAVYFFVQALLSRRSHHTLWLLLESLIVAGVSLGTGLVDRSETIKAGIHVTTYGVLFPLYVLHLLLYLVPALYRALWPDPKLPHQQRQQVRMVGIGILITAAIGITTNVVIPYIYGNFRFIDWGTLATITALAAIAYAAMFYHLFNLRVVIKATIVFAMMIAFALELYQLAVGALTKLLPVGDPTERHIAAASVAFIINAFTQQPLRWWLERLADRLLKRKPHSRVRR